MVVLDLIARYDGLIISDFPVCEEIHGIAFLHDNVTYMLFIVKHLRHRF